ncbi:Autoinducer 2 (AI-2) modifying protein LsrG [hydrothermal vent metagenome]|uniref:Autoinducer 2 (AI-2) modifying protein LsrG n=1 Tax=hydrothermal vent metagenome TaxID=652676 RepID=A0A3B1AFK0_9ZZZZ
MIVTIVNVHVNQKDIESFIKATELNHLGSIKEPGNVRFDVIQQEANPCKFVLYEAFKTKEDINKHKETSHYLEWRNTVDAMMAETRSATVHAGLFL